MSYRPARLHRLAESIPGLHKRLLIRALCSPTQFSTVVSQSSSPSGNPSLSPAAPVNQYLLSAKVTTVTNQIFSDLCQAPSLPIHAVRQTHRSAIPSSLQYLTVSKSLISTRLSTQQLTNPAFRQAQQPDTAVIQALMFARLGSQPIPAVRQKQQSAKPYSSPDTAVSQALVFARLISRATANPCCSTETAVSQTLLFARHSSQPSPAVRQAQKSANTCCLTDTAVSQSLLLARFSQALLFARLRSQPIPAVCQAQQPVSDVLKNFEGR